MRENKENKANLTACDFEKIIAGFRFLVRKNLYWNDYLGCYGVSTYYYYCHEMEPYQEGSYYYPHTFLCHFTGQQDSPSIDTSNIDKEFDVALNMLMKTLNQEGKKKKTR